MPLELPGPAERDRPPAAGLACRFCGTHLSPDQSSCPRCGLERTAEIPTAAVSPEPPAAAPSYVAMYSPTSQPSPPPYPTPPAYPPPAGFGPAPGYGPDGYPLPPDAPYAAYADQPIGSKRWYTRPIWILAAVIAVILVVGGVVLGVTSSDSANSASSVKVPDGPGVVYRSSKGRFAVRFPELPDERTIPATVASVSLSIVIAADQESNTAVESERISQALPSDEITDALTSAIKSTGSSAAITLTSDSATTFQGHPAHRGEYQTTTGVTLSALAFSYSNTRIYELLAPSGSAFDDLAASFVAVP